MSSPNLDADVARQLHLAQQEEKRAAVERMIQERAQQLAASQSQRQGQIAHWQIPSSCPSCGSPIMVETQALFADEEPQVARTCHQACPQRRSR